MIRKNPYVEEKYTHYKVGEDKPLLEWLLANLKESKSKIKATLQNRGIKVNGKCVTQFDHPCIRVIGCRSVRVRRMISFIIAS